MSQLRLDAWVRANPTATDQQIKDFAKDAQLYSGRRVYKPIGKRIIQIARRHASRPPSPVPDFHGKATPAISNLVIK